MTALAAVAHAAPERVVEVDDYLRQSVPGEDPTWYQAYYGFRQVRRAPDEPLADQLGAAVAALPGLPALADRVRYVVYAPTIQLSRPFPNDLLATVCRDAGLRRASAFSLSQHACASALLAVDACGRLLAADQDDDATALVLTGEKTFTRVARLIPHSAVMGEGACAVLVRVGPGPDQILAYETQTLGRYHRAPFQSAALDEEFRQRYPQALAQVIRDAVARSGLTMDDIALVLPHNVNRMSWWRVMRLLGLPRDRLQLDNQARYGHCFGADPFLNYLTARDAGRLAPGDCYVMTAAGLGATLAAMVLRH